MGRVVLLVLLVMVVVVVLSVRSPVEVAVRRRARAENPGVVWAQLQSYCLSGCETQSARL